MNKGFVTEKSFEVYKTSLALQKHFSSSYDYFKYGGKIKASIDSFSKRRDGYFYHKLSKRKDWFDYLLANYLEDPKVWIGTLCNSEECLDRYTRFVRRIESLTYVYQSDLKKLDPNFNLNFRVSNGRHPYLLELYRTGNITLETLTILDNLVGFFRHWDEKISDPIVYPSISTKCRKYGPFLSSAYDREKMKSLTFKHFENIG